MLKRSINPELNQPAKSIRDKATGEESMRVVGHRKERPISFAASGELLAEGARFNDEIHKLPSGSLTCIPKGVFRFRTHAEANEHSLNCVSKAVAQTTLERR